MSPRRRITALCLAALTAAGAGAATLSWPVGTPTAAAFVSRGLRDYGLALTADGPSTMTLLPLPRLSFSRTRLTGIEPGAPALIEGGSLTLELNPLALISGRSDIGSIALDRATFHLPRGGADARWAEPMRRIAGRVALGGSEHPRRLTLTRATLDAPEPDGGARDVDLTVAWPFWGGTVDAAASLTWRGVRTNLTLAGVRAADLLNGSASPFTANAAWPGGTLAAAGDVTAAGGLALAGQGRIETGSLPETLAWLGADIALSSFTRALTLDGRFATAGRTVSLPSVRAVLGGDVLEGAGSVSLGERRVSVQATLAAERLNLAPLVGGLVRMFDPDPGTEGATPPRSIALAPLTGGDLDLRISAAGSRIGPVLLEDLAASVLVRPGSVEVALIRAGIQGATLKGRVALSAGADGAETEIKAQGAFDRLDLGALLADLGESRWVLGGTQGQFALESSGRDVAGLAARVAGRAAFAIDGGMIAGLDLADVMHRNGAVAPGALARRNGRTPFERAAVALKFADGIGEIGEGSLRAAGLSGLLRGQVSLPGRSVRAQAEIGSRNPGANGARPVTIFEIAGPWDAVSVRAARGGTEPEPRDEAQPLHLPASTGLPGAARAYAP